MITQGRNIDFHTQCCFEHVTKYTVEYSVDGVHFDPVKDSNGNPIVSYVYIPTFSLVTVLITYKYIYSINVLICLKHRQIIEFFKVVALSLRLRLLLYSILIPINSFI